MTQNKIFVITGAIASGKSSVCNILKKYNEIVISADEKASGIYDIMEVKEKVIKEFGTIILDENQEVDKSKLRRELFENPEKLSALNKITHPVIMDRVKKCVDKYSNNRVFVEIPVYFESKALIDDILDVDKVIYIDADVETRVNRLIKRSGLDRKEAEAFVRLQMPDSAKKLSSDIVIYNDFDMISLEEKVIDVLNFLKS